LRPETVPAPALRVLRYGCVGLAISLIYSLAVIAAVHVLHPIGPTMASVLAFAVVLPLSWLAHGRISFGDRPRDAFQPLRFALSTTASFAVAIGGMYWITEIAGRSYLLGIAWNWLIIPAMNFSIYMFWVFSKARKARSIA
jgi:putative flippase GtrA